MHPLCLQKVWEWLTYSPVTLAAATGVDLIKQFRPNFTDKNKTVQMHLINTDFSCPFCTIKSKNEVQNDQTQLSAVLNLSEIQG
jgi:hypothetical protein